MMTRVNYTNTITPNNIKIICLSQCANASGGANILAYW